MLFLDYDQVIAVRIGSTWNFDRWKWAVLSNTMRVEVFKPNDLFPSLCVFRCKDYATHNTPSAHVVNNGHGRVNARSVKWRNENCDIVNECLIDILPELIPLMMLIRVLTIFVFY